MPQSFLAFRISPRFLAVSILLVVLVAVGFAVSYARSNVSVQQYFRVRAAKAAVADYVDNAVLKTIERLVAEVDRLRLAAEALRTDRSAENLEAVAATWHSAYGAWNEAAAYLYGPAAQYDYWKQLASWPCDKVLIEHALAMMEAGELRLDSRYLREERVAALRGFHAMRYLLFRNGRPRDAEGMDSAELDYLAAAAQALLEESIDFEASWRGTANLPAEKVAVLEKAGIKERPGYAAEFANPGTPGSRYASLSIPLQEIFQEISGVLEDMAPGVDELLGTPGAGEAAYWESVDPVADLLDWLRSVENAYLGGVEGHRDGSVAELVAAHDAALDRLIRISLAHTAYRIEALRDSADKSSEERGLAVKIAAAELEKLMARFAVAVPQVILDPAVEPYAAYVN